MKKTISLNDFRDAFRDCNRTENFSYEGLGALFDWIEEAEEDYELDVISLCCDFSEYADLEEFHRNYDKEDYPDFETLGCLAVIIPVDEERFITDFK